MSQVPLRLVSVTLASLLLGSLFSAAPALGAMLTRQEFEGDLTLIENSPLLENTLPDKSEYSGLVVYEEDGTLRDWKLIVDELELNLDPDSILGDDFVSLTPTVDFELFSETDWNLVIDFGIAFDAPRYTLERMSGSEIIFTGEVGLAGGYVYIDPAATITLSTSDTSVPEPATILGIILVSSAGASLLKRKCCA